MCLGGAVCRLGVILEYLLSGVFPFGVSGCECSVCVVEACLSML